MNMKKWMSRVILIVAYMVPYVFLSVYGDAVLNTMILCLMMISAFAILCVASIKSHNLIVMIIGNIISMTSSLATAYLSGLTELNWYFKPFTAHSLVIIISAVALIIQIILYVISKRKYKKLSQ